MRLERLKDSLLERFSGMTKKGFIAVITCSCFVAFAADFNVKKFGAVGDGVADDAPAIQKAIDAAQVKGGCVYFPAGDYRIKKTLLIGGNTSSLPTNWLTLRGEGGGSKLYGDGVDFILAGRTNPGSKSPWMNGARIESLTFRSFDIKNRCNGIDLSLMLRVYISSCNFIRCKSAIASETAFTPYPDPKRKGSHSIWIVRIQDCIFSLNSSWAISIRRAFDVVISNNTIEHGNGGIQIGFKEDAKDAACNTLRIVNNVIEGMNASGKPAVRLCCVVGGQIVGNYFEANHSGDLEITPEKGGWFRGCIITANTFQPTAKQRKNGVYGPILIQKAIDTTICNNFTTGSRLIHGKSAPLGRNIAVFGNTLGNPASLGFDGASEAERKAYEQFVAINSLNRNRFVLTGQKGQVGIDTEQGIVFNENAISYSDKVPATGKTGDVVFNRKPEVKNGRVIIGWYCVSGGKTPRWCPLSFDAAEKK